MAEAVTSEPQPALAYEPQIQAEKTAAQEESSLLEGTGKFDEKREWRDVFWAVLWIAQVVGTFAMLGYFVEKSKTVPGFEDKATIDEHFWPMLGILVACGSVVSFMMLTVINACAAILIWFTLLISLALFLTGAILCFAEGVIWGGIVYTVIFVLEFLYILFIRKRIEFAVTMLGIVIECIQEYKATVVASFLGTCAQAAWSILWLASAMYAIKGMQNDLTNGSIDGFIYFFIIFSMYWTAQVIQNLVHVTIAGTLASWYFYYPHNMPKNPTLKAAMRSLTTSLGSICFGSLIVAVVQAFRSMVQTLVDNINSKCVQCCLLCMLSCIQSLAQYFNVYALTQVAIYGKSYCNAARDTWKLFAAKGFDFLINDDLIGGVLYLGSLVGAAANLGISLLISNFLYPDMTDGDRALWATAGFFIGWVLTVCAMVVVRSSVASFFVCFAEDPQPFADNQPDLYNLLQKAWEKRYGDKVSYPAGV